MILQAMSGAAGVVSAFLWIAAAYVKVEATQEEANPESFKVISPNVTVTTAGTGFFYKEPSGRIINLGKTLRKQGSLNGCAALAAAAAILLQIAHMAIAA